MEDIRPAKLLGIGAISGGADKFAELLVGYGGGPERERRYLDATHRPFSVTNVRLGTLRPHQERPANNPYFHSCVKTSEIKGAVLRKNGIVRATMRPAGKVIVTCAVTGSAHTPTMNNDIPMTIDEHVEQSVAAAAAGAAVIHLHARNPQDGRPVSDVGIFRDYCRGIKDSCDAVISITTGGATGQTVEERLRVIKELKPELATCNLGTMNYGLFQMIPRYEGRWKYDWEEPYLASTKDEPFVSRFSDIEYMLTTLAAETGCRFEFEAYDIGHLYTLAFFADQGLVPTPIFMQFVIGTLGGIGADVENVFHMKEAATRLFGHEIEWGILGGGRSQFDLITAGATLGGNVRVGLEDSIYLRRGKLAESNAEQVEKIVRILDELSRTPMTPDETREVLGLKGLSRVAF